MCAKRVKSAEFSAILTQLRKDAGITQRQAAAELNVSQSLLSSYERGIKEPGLTFVCRACDFYGVTADFLLGRSRVDQVKIARQMILQLSGYLREMTEQMDKLLTDRQGP